MSQSDTLTRTRPVPRFSIPRFGVYTTHLDTLFVPTEDMLLVHEAARPAAVLARAGLTDGAWRHWQRLGNEKCPWLLGWLYQADAPDEGAAADVLTSAMHDFRAQTTAKAIASSARRPEAAVQARRRRTYAGGRYKGHVNVNQIIEWRRGMKDQPWFDPWLLRGEAPPADVTVATRGQVRSCASAWDYRGICRRLGIDVNFTYFRWLKRRLIPDAAWLRWLYGAPEPAGAFVVGLRLWKLRSETSREAVCRAAGLSETVGWLWEKRRNLSAVLLQVKRAAASPGVRPSSLASVPEWAGLPPKTRNAMWRFAKAATLKECLRRAGLCWTQYSDSLRRAEQLGVRAELDRFLACRDKTKLSQAGLLAPNFFAPTKAMLDFRKEAARLAAEHGLRFVADLPGFDEWFIDWAVPRRRAGRRLQLPGGGASGGGGVSADPGRGPAGAGTADSATTPQPPPPAPLRHPGHVEASPPSSRVRERDPQTAKLYKYCYEMLRSRLYKRSRICELAKKEFPSYDLVESDVTNYARRHAERAGAPWPV